jgi:uncharacterized protein (TIGR00251 family)
MKNSQDLRQAFSASEDGTFLSVEVTSGSHIEQFPVNYNPWRQTVGIHVKAQAIEGKANKAIIALIADILDISKSSVHIVSGQTSSIKRVFIEGISPDTLYAILARFLPGSSDQ